MYENLLRLPYFLGMNKDDITSILDKVTFEFVKYSDGDTICRNGESCNEFRILVQGRMRIVSHAMDNSHKLTEEIAAPHAIEPYSMFGYSTSYNREYSANGNCTILVIKKEFLFSELTKHSIFTINFLNLVCNKAQKLENTINTHLTNSIAGRIHKFILLRCEQHHGRKILSIKMEKLATILCETRLNISKSLNELQDYGLVELHRKEIVIPSLNKLTDYIKEQEVQ